MVWFVLGHSGQRTSVKCAEAAWNYKAGGIVHLKSPAFVGGVCGGVCVCVCSIQVIFSVIQVSFEKFKFSCNQIWVKDATGVTLYDNEFKCRAPRSKLYRKCEIGIMLKVVSSVTTIETQFIDANWGIWGEIWGCCLGMGDVKDYSGVWWNPIIFILSIS